MSLFLVQVFPGLEHVFDKLIKCNLKLNIDKCAFFRKQLISCGHVVSEEDFERDPDKVVKVRSWPRPANVEQVRAFLGFAGYYRRFVRNFARIAKPLTDLLGGFDNRERKERGNRSPGSISWAEQWRWGEEQRRDSSALKEYLTTPPVLAYADYTKPFILHTDASYDGLGAVLCQ